MWQEKAMGLSIFATAVALALVLILPGAAPPADASLPLTTEDGTPLTTASFPNEDEEFVIATWSGRPAMLIALDRSLLEASSEVYHRDTLIHAFDHPRTPHLAVLAFQGWDNHLGCTNGLLEGYGGDRHHPDLNGDGINESRIIGLCHQQQFNPYNLGKHIAGPADGDLWMLELKVHTDGTLWGTQVELDD